MQYEVKTDMELLVGNLRHAQQGTVYDARFLTLQWGQTGSSLGRTRELSLATICGDLQAVVLSPHHQDSTSIFLFNKVTS